MKIIALRIGAWVTKIFLGGFVSKPDPAKPLAAAWYYAKEPERGQRLFVFLPGRRDRASDFVRHGFVSMVQRMVSGSDCVAVDATIGYYFDGSVADRLHREIIGPARRVPVPTRSGWSVFPWADLELFFTSACTPAK